MNFRFVCNVCEPESKSSDNPKSMTDIKCPLCGDNLYISAEGESKLSLKMRMSDMEKNMLNGVMLRKRVVGRKLEIKCIQCNSLDNNHLNNCSFNSILNSKNITFAEAMNQAMNFKKTEGETKDERK